MKKTFYLSILLVILLACSVSAFDFYGYVYDVNKTPINNTNVSMEIYLQGGGGPPTLITTFNGTSNGTGWFNVSGITENNSYSYKPVIRHYNSTTGDADYVSQSLPDLPLMEVQNISPIDFYLREGATINITAVGEQESLGIVNETAHYTVVDYGLGLEWDGSFWGYLNSSGNLIMLNTSFSENKSYFVNMTGIDAFDYANSAWYFVNTSHVRKFIDNGSALILNATYNLTCNASYNYSIISTIEYIGSDEIFFVMGNRTDGNTAITDFNSSTFECVNEMVIDEPLGLLQWYDGEVWIITNEFGYYEILRDPEMGGESWNISSPSIEGIGNNGSAWFYASATRSNITEFELLYTDVKSFNYMIKDVALGYPVAENFDNATNQATVYLPADRNYSIMLYPDMSFPISYDLNNISDYAGNHVDIIFNTSEQWRWVGGYVNFGGSYAFDDLNIIGYLIEPGDMIFQEHPLPYNMSAWRSTSTTDRYNASVGFYNITLPGAVMEAEILLFAVAKNGSDYYGGFRNITLNFSNATVSDFNFTLYPLVGSTDIITLQGEEDKNVTVKKASIQLNDENGSAITEHAFTEIQVDYSGLPGGYEFSWMVDVSADDNGSLKIILLNGTGVERMNIFSQQYAPQKTSFTAAEVATGSLEVNLSGMFEPKSPEGEEFMDLFIDMIKSNAACDVPDYNMSACSLFPNSSEMNKSGPDFNPFKIVLGGGKISFVMRKDSNNITVHYKNVDMLASGPPDALFDSSATESELGSSLEMAWRFGSQGPEIYDEVLIGIPLGGEVDFNAPVSILLENLYDENWNVIWNADTNTTGEIPSDYSDFNISWFNTSTNGMPCSTSVNTAPCFVNTTNEMAWIIIPHFSGVGPTVQSVSEGNVTAESTLASYNCTESCSVFINVSNENYTIAQSLHNITISTLDVNGNIANISIYWYNNSVSDFELHDSFIGNGTNSTNQSDYNLTLYNGSATTQHKYRLNITKSANPGTTLNITYNITDLFALTLSLSLNCVEAWSYSDWTACSGETQTRTAADAHSCGTTNDRGALEQSCTSGSSGGGGGGGVTTNPKTSKTWDKMTPGGTYIMKVKSDDFGVKQISIEVRNHANNVKIQIEKLPGQPASITKEITGNVYRYMEITKSNLGAENIKGKIMLKFHVTRSWLLQNGYDAKDIVLKRFNNDAWEDLKTSLLSTDDKYAYYEGETPGLSYFAIGLKGEAVAEEEPAAEEEEAGVTEEPAAGEEKEAAVVAGEEGAEEEETAPAKKGGLSTFVYIIILVVIVGVIVLIIYRTSTKKAPKAVEEKAVEETEKKHESHKDGKHHKEPAEHKKHPHKKK